MEDYAIKFEHVSKIYKLKKKNDGKSKSSVTQRFYALNDITFTIPKGEVHKLMRVQWISMENRL